MATKPLDWPKTKLEYERDQNNRGHRRYDYSEEPS
jgi:hypothetical protein